MTAARPPDATRSGQVAVTLDATDRRIVEALRADGRLSMRALAERLHISRAGVYTRVERLHQLGVLTLTCGTYGNVIRFLVPLTASDQLVRDGMDIFETSLTEAVTRVA